MAAGVGIALVPASVRHLHRSEVHYRPLADGAAVSPVIMNARVGDEGALLKQLRTLAMGLVHRRATD